MSSATGRDAPPFWAAPDIAKAGYPVFPTAPKDKNPSVEGGFYAATTDPSEIAAWIEAGRGTHNIAVPTGVVSRVVVIEADTPEMYAEMEERYGPPTVKTKRGGHWWFRHPRNGRVRSNKVREGLDRKGDGGYVLVPPSLGRTWTNGIPQLQGLDVLPEEFWTKQAERTDAPRSLPEDRKEAAAAGIAARAARVQHGDRHAHLKHLCGVLLAREIPFGDAEDILIGAWTKAGGELAERAPREVPNTLRTTEQALAEGRATGVPSLEKITPGLYEELAGIFGWLHKVTIGDKADLRDAEDEVSLSPSLNGQGHQGHPIPEENHGVKLPRATAFRELAEPGERRYLVNGLVPAAYPTMIFGDGGSAKSLLAMSLGTAIVVGEEWLGYTVMQTSVLYLDFELDASEQSRRARQVAKGAGLEEPPEGFYYLSALGLPVRDAFRAAYVECRARGIGMLILDSLGPALEGDAEASRDVIGFYSRVMEPFRALGTGVFMVDHQAKLQAGERYQSKRAFGSVFKTNLARSVIQVEARDREEGRLAVTLRQTKHNFGYRADPFGVAVTFTDDQIAVQPEKLDPADLAEEGTLNSADRVRLALEDGPQYPTDIAETTGLAVKTVKNALTKLRKAGDVETTGKVENQAEEVSLVSSSFKGQGRGHLTAEDVITEIRRERSGPAKAFEAYQDMPSDKRLEYLAKAVLTARKLDAAKWRHHRDAVEAAILEAGGGA